MFRPDRIGLYAAGLYLLSLLGAMIAPVDKPSIEPTSPPAKPVRSEQGLQKQQVIGFSLNVHYTNQLPKYLRAIDMIADMGCNSLQILTPAFQQDGASTKISIPNQPGRCPSTDQLMTLLRHAQKRGLKTMLMPTVLFTHPRGNEWRGKISPDDWDQWWESYSVTLRHFANLAQQTGVDVFCVGSELLSTEKQTTRWQTLIADIRKDFHGQLIYATNWDHYHVPTFWEHLDYVGISGYWSMTKDTLDQVLDAQASFELHQQIVKRWPSIQKSLKDFSREIQKPVLITEFGYPSLPWGLKDPWNYVNAKQVSAMPQVQAIGYRAFCESWQSEITPNRPIPTHGFAGVLFYTWDPYNGGLSDSGYGVWGKPAQQILTNWLKRQ